MPCICPGHQKWCCWNTSNPVNKSPQKKWSKWPAIFLWTSTPKIHWVITQNQSRFVTFLLCSTSAVKPWSRLQLADLWPQQFGAKEKISKNLADTLGASDGWCMLMHLEKTDWLVTQSTRTTTLSACGCMRSRIWRVFDPGAAQSLHSCRRYHALCQAHWKKKYTSWLGFEHEW